MSVEMAVFQHGLLPDLNVVSEYHKNIEHRTIENLSPQISEFLSAMAEVQAAKAITSSSLEMQPPKDVFFTGGY